MRVAGPVRVARPGFYGKIPGRCTVVIGLAVAARIAVAGRRGAGQPVDHPQISLWSNHPSYRFHVFGNLCSYALC
jgi:hypothetical protein